MMRSGGQFNETDMPLKGFTIKRKVAVLDGKVTI
jgi:hypothetical protein